MLLFYFIQQYEDVLGSRYFSELCEELRYFNKGMVVVYGIWFAGWELPEIPAR